MSVLDYVVCTHQEWTEEDERDKVEVSKLAATLWLWISCQGVALLAPQTRQHDLMPRLPRRTPERHTKRFCDLWSKKSPRFQIFFTKNSLFLYEMLKLNTVYMHRSTKHTHLKSSMRAITKVWKLLCGLMALSPSSSIAIFPNSCWAHSYCQHWKAHFSLVTSLALFATNAAPITLTRQNTPLL